MEALECGSCQKPLKFKVLSVAATRTRRWVWLVLGLAGVAAALGFGVAIFQVGGQVVEEGPPTRSARWRWASSPGSFPGPSA